MIAIVIIIYHPKSSTFDKYMPSDGYVIVVDNTPQPSFKRNIVADTDNFIYIPLNKNLGIAAAQNIGIRKAVDLGCSYIVFLDQDSVIGSHYIHSIVSEYQKIISKQKNLFLLGPIVINERTHQEYKSVFHQDICLHSNFIYRKEIISSGSCVSVEKIKDVGFLDEKLFIDFVDFEWCWRANKKSYICGITPNVRLLHNVGQREIRFGKYKVIISAPFRYFYQYRNFLWLCRRNYVPTYWKLSTGIKFLLRIFYFPVRLKNGWSIEKYMWKGIRAGLKYGK